MNLYVWEGVFRDWSAGMAVALANSKEEAIGAVIKVHDTQVEDLRSVKPKVVRLGDVGRKRPVAWAVSGGG